MRTLAGVAVVAVLFLVGCGSNKPPVFTVLDARITERTEHGTVVSFRVQGDNPNRDHLTLQEFAYEVTIDGTRVFGGVRSPLTTLSGFGVQTFTVPAAVAGEVAPGASYIISGEVRYMPPTAWTQTKTDMGFSPPSASVRGEGQVRAGG